MHIMEWIRLHPFLSLSAVAFLFLVTGAQIVREHVLQQVPQTDTVATWGGGTIGAINVTSETHAATDSAVAHASVPSPIIDTPYHYVSPFVPKQVPSTAVSSASSDGYTDFATFAAMLQKNIHTEQQKTSDAVPSDAYSYIPQGMFVIGSTEEASRTPLQKALIQYGNEIGTIIKSYENMHTNQVGVLKDFAEDRVSPEKTAAMKRLGNDLVGVGESIRSIDVPTQAKNLNLALAASYVDIGTKLAMIPDAKRDEDLVSAMETYDTAAESFVKNFVGVALLFPAYRVNFTNEDGGSVFMLPSGQGL